MSVSLAFVQDLAQRAGRVLLEGSGRQHHAETKRAHTDLVTEFDRRSEQLLVDEIQRAHPDHHILAEEGGGVGADPSRATHRWLIDPLDGTTNFAHGLPFFCVSIALEVEGTIVLGVVEAPALGWSLAAERGGGATLNGRPLHVSDTSHLAASLLATGFPYDRATNPRNNLAEFAVLKRLCHGVRRVGSAALDLSMVAAGWLDGYWEMRLKPWDLAAGSLLVTEAGGRVTSWRGDPFEAESGEIVATNGHIHAELVAALHSVAAPAR